MRVLALISGGKDSGFAALECLAHGHEIVALGHLHPPASHASDELDSYMFQTVGHGAVRLLQECFGDGRVPLFQRAIVGKPEKVDLVYQSDNAAAADEVEDLYELVRHVQQSIPNLEAVSVGAILSDYQRLRVEDVCARLGLISLAYLWAQPQQPLVERMLAAGLDAVLVKVAALGLAPRKHLGRHLRDLLPELVQLADKYELNVAGEGGEYESLLLDLPTFHRRLVLDETELVIDAGDSSVGHLHVVRAHTEPKETLGLVPDGLVRSIDDYLAPYGLVGLYDTRPDRPSALGLAQPSLSSRDLGEPWAGLLLGGSLVGVANLVADDLDVDALLDRCEALLAPHGASLASMLAVHVTVRWMDDYAALNKAYGRRFRYSPPTRAAVACSALPGRISLSGIAYRPPTAHPLRIVHTHVQSISHWAPANIGPYSQAVTVGPDLVFLAGTIGLIPAMMTLPPSPGQEPALSLRNVLAVLERHGSSPESVIAMTCFGTSERALLVARNLWRYRAPLLCVLVSALPRGASIEWWPVAARDSSAQRLVTTPVTARTPEGASIEGIKVGERFLSVIVEPGQGIEPGQDGAVVEPDDVAPILRSLAQVSWNDLCVAPRLAYPASLVQRILDRWRPVAPIDTLSCAYPGAQTRVQLVFCKPEQERTSD